ncbi:MAG: pitrilysin family protein [Candidatus Spechtbacterales bacterium]|nr:pitrilysin family protein [Candidatus Spechtbacterales bacterium]
MEIIERKLDNGIPVFLLPSSFDDFFVHMCAANAGSRYETAERNGMSHFLEHMMFKGTKKRKTAQDIAIELEEMGARHNAYTGKEIICFYIDTVHEKFRQVADIMSDQIINSVMRREDVDKERNVVFQEMAMYESDPSDYVFELIAPMLYGDQAAGRNILGTRESVGSVTPRKLRYWHRRYFNRDNLVVVASGKFPSLDVTMDILNNYYKDVPQIKPPKIFPLEDIDTQLPKLSVEYRDIPQSQMVLVARSLSAASADRMALYVATGILGGGMSSRLFEEVREQRGLAYSIYAFGFSNSDTGYAGVYAGTEPSKLREAIEVIRYELIKISEEGVSDEELKKVKNMRRIDFLRKKSDYHSMASFLVQEYTKLGRVTTIDEILESLEKVTAEDIGRVVSDVFAPDNLHLAVVGPHEGSIEEAL